MTMRIAAAAYPVEVLPDWDSLHRKIAQWVAEADAELVVFPEYAGLEAALIGATTPLDTAEETKRAAAAAPRYWQMVTAIARAHKTTLLAGSLPARSETGDLVNRAALVTPHGGIAFVDKRQLTPWEQAETPLRPGTALPVFDPPDLPRLGVLICYDGEFPSQARAIRQTGAQLLLMPSATEGATGASRVRIAARARALESGGHVALAQTVGDCALSSYLDRSAGQAGIYVAPDSGAPPDGILAETAPDTPGWARAPISSCLPEQVDIASAWDGQHNMAQLTPFAQKHA
ncbi:nitrilase-related carbon-nitrogen hydrolase [Dinoroseobacter sp. S375]|uniref:nitrilase-related carbon-nitrogen hydrolase n=1 Tax=Dinoroseobacter sp. S375 TaxID=3415136 RepID=UPI003C7DC48D